MRGYTFPSRDPTRTATKWQREMSAFLVSEERCFLFGEMGVSKTAAAIWAADYLLQTGAIKKVLVVGRISLLRDAWVNDLSWVGNSREHVVVNSQSNLSKLDKQLRASHFVMTNYEALAKLDFPAGMFDLVIADESTRIKNPGTKLHKTFVRTIANIHKRWFITGSPMPTEYLDIYGQAVALGALSGLPSNYWLARSTIMRNIEGTDMWVYRSNALEIATEWAQPAFYVNKAEAMGDMKPPVHYFLPAPLTVEQQQLIYLHMELAEDTYKRSVLEKGEVGSQLCKPTPENVWQKFGRSIACGAVPKGNADSLKEPLVNALHREELLVSLVKTTTRKVLVFTPYIVSCDRLQQVLEASGYKFLIIRGDVSASGRATILEEFRSNPVIKGIVAVPEAMAHGVNGTAADTVIWYGAPGSAESYMQANERIYRYGQTSEMVIYHIYSGAVEFDRFKKWTDNIKRQWNLMSTFGGS